MLSQFISKLDIHVVNQIVDMHNQLYKVKVLEELQTRQKGHRDRYFVHTEPDWYSNSSLISVTRWIAKNGCHLKIRSVLLNQRHRRQTLHDL